MAQTLTVAVAPEHYSIDERGVDMVTGAYVWSASEVVIGEPGSGGLVHGRGAWGETNQGQLAVGNATYPGTTVIFEGRSETFDQSGSTYTPRSNNGSTLSVAGTIYTYTTSTGLVVKYDTALCASATGGTCSHKGMITEVIAPNGERRQYHYTSATYVRSVNPTTSEITWGTVRRVQSITNNYGYELHYTYRSNNINASGTLTNRIGNWLGVATVTGVNNAVDYCAPAALSCSYSRTWPSVAYTQAVGDYVTATTDESGRTTQYIHGGTPRNLTAIRHPGSTSDDVALSYSGPSSGSLYGSVASVTDATGTWTYSFTDSGILRTAVSNGPQGQKLTVITDVRVGRPFSIENAYGETILQTYDSQQRLQRQAQVSGAAVEYSYDGRGNVTQTKTIPYGSGSPIVETATYNATCANPVICNRPLTTTDARGNVTDYVWDPVHGGPSTITLPAAGAGGVRPELR
ncbi:hypothetical protein GCM10009422_18240 [Brevundimonas kwangchunensis]|uniref:RHS repeat protein n=1 Tax=Brevundimonas kwangchunensis TaxID=322163 RepID=A0ABP3S0E3_9CAUL